VQEGERMMLRTKNMRSADKFLARHTSRCRRTESIVLLERGVCSCAELQHSDLLVMLDLYSRGAPFESGPGHRISHIFSLFPPVPPGKLLG
jgi:hypothetical protein